MIEITHQQARRMIRQNLDGRLPDGQWAALQAHLERCPDCRAYLTTMQDTEKNLRRAARGRYDRISGPGEGVLNEVMAARSRKIDRHNRLTYAAGMLAAALVLFLIVRGALAPEPVREPAPASALLATPTAGLAATPFPTAQPGEFGGVVAFESRRDGNAEIYLLNPGAQPENITNHPADDTHPAWSPDGEWLAFLSTRLPDSNAGQKAKSEVYVMHISGTRLVPLTAEPGVEWQGPLSWSADGLWITLSGMRIDQGGQRYVYLVPLDGSGPRSLSGSRTGYAPEFAPTGDRLAYMFSDGSRAGVSILDLDSPAPYTATWKENSLASAPHAGSALDWSRDGASLAFVSSSPVLSAGGSELPRDGVPNGGPPSGGSAMESGPQVVAVRDVRSLTSLPTGQANNTRVASSRWPGAYRGVSWSGGGAVLYLEELDDPLSSSNDTAEPLGCWVLQARLPGLRAQQGRIFPTGELCIEGGVDRGSWSSDGRWLVVKGRLIGSATQSLYAVRIYGRGSGSADGGQPDSPPGTVFRLTGDADAGLVGTELPRVRPRRAFSQALNIDPQPVRFSSTGGYASSPDRPLSQLGQAGGQVVFTYYQNTTTTTIAVTNPDGSGGRILASVEGRSSCPRWSPDGRQVAYVSDRLYLHQGAGESAAEATAAQPSDDLFVMAARPGAQAVTVTRPDLFPGAEQVNYGCPAWSPDGRWLAAFVEIDGGYALAVLPSGAEVEQNSGDAEDAVTDSGADADSPADILPAGWVEPLEMPTGGPVWTPDSRRLLLAHIIPGERSPQVLAFDLPGAEPLPEAVTRTPVPARTARPAATPGPTSTAIPVYPYRPDEAPGELPLPAAQPTPTPLAQGSSAGAPGGAPPLTSFFSEAPGWVLPSRAGWANQPAAPTPTAQAGEGEDGTIPQTGTTGGEAADGEDAADAANAVLRRSVLRMASRWRAVNGMAISPDGWELILLSSSILTDSRAMAVLNRVDMQSPVQRMPVAVGQDNPRLPTTARALTWLPDGSLGFILRGQPGDRYKALIRRYDLNSRTVQTLAAVEDVLYEAAWSPDGRYVLFSTESGLWGLDLDAARRGMARPTWLSADPVVDMDWK